MFAERLLRSHQDLHGFSVGVHPYGRVQGDVDGHDQADLTDLQRKGLLQQDHENWHAFTVQFEKKVLVWNLYCNIFL